jgi:cation/acetate symporter
MKRTFKLLVPSLLLAVAFNAFAATETFGNVQKQPVNMTAITMFLAFVVVTLGITWWAASRTKSMEDFYTGRGSTGFQNGLALAGDYMSAAALLGVTSMIFFNGYDGMIYSISFFVAWPLLLFLFAERIRNLGRVTISDIASFRLDQDRIRTLTAFGSLTVVCFYLVVQMDGAGQLIQLLFGLQYNEAVIAVGILMAVYVTFGGMAATTWVQIIKAVLMLIGATLLAVLALSKFGFSINSLFEQAIATHKNGSNIMLPSKLVADPIAMISLSFGLVFGTAGLPHILMRFFTARDAAQARKSVFVATGFIGFFFLVMNRGPGERRGLGRAVARGVGQGDGQRQGDFPVRLPGHRFDVHSIFLYVARVGHGQQHTSHRRTGWIRRSIRACPDGHRRGSRGKSLGPTHVDRS